MTETAVLDDVHKRVMKHRAEIIREVKAGMAAHIFASKSTHNYKTAWNDLQSVATPIVQRLLEAEFGSTAEFYITDSKSTYPDLEMKYNGLRIAFDIKSNESEKEPWYDIARLDTIVTERITKFDEEYDLLLKYDRATGSIVEAFFELMRDTVGVNRNSGGVKYRPYDGKLRPKSWEDFEKGKTYWKSKQDFLTGIRKSQLYRWKVGIRTTLLPLLTEKEKEEFKSLF